MRRRSNAPVGHTCPDIDKMIAMLEDLRSSNSLLRSWGDEETERANGLDTELEETRDALREATDDKEQFELDLADMTKERDDLRARVAQLEGELEATRQYIHT